MATIFIFTASAIITCIHWYNHLYFYYTTLLSVTPGDMVGEEEEDAWEPGPLDLQDQEVGVQGAANKRGRRNRGSNQKDSMRKKQRFRQEKTGIQGRHHDYN